MLLIDVIGVKSFLLRSTIPVGGPLQWRHSITVMVRPHPVFRHEGDDILVVLPITIDEAVLGGKVSAPTIDGPVGMTIPPGASSGQVLRLRGRGVGRAGQTAKGRPEGRVEDRITARTRRETASVSKGMAQDPEFRSKGRSDEGGSKMTDRFSEDDVVATVTRLTRRQLVRFIEAEVVRPAPEPDGYVFRRVDIARLELLCDLTVDLDLDEMALGIVISLIDQLHAARRDLADITAALDAVPADLRAEIAAALKQLVAPQ